MTIRIRLASRLILAVCVTAFCVPGWSQQQGNNLTDMGLEDLLNVKVTSVSKKEQKVSQSAAAIFVLDSEDIARSGAASIPDLLRLVPGLEVAQIDGGTWAVTSRGFNGEFSNKLLVLVDGRTVYDPSFTGVYWDVQDTLLEDIERIEVIRGPGATIWGSNAVNGVINILTKKAKATKGGLVTSEGGSEEQRASVRYGGSIGNNLSYRVFGRYINQESSEGLRELGQGDGLHLSRGGFRMDWEGPGRDSATVEGDFYRGAENAPYNGGAGVLGGSPTTAHDEVSGGDLLVRWNHKFAGGSEMSVQTYVDRLERINPFDPNFRSTFDVEVRNHQRAGRHDIVWGLGFRENRDRLGGLAVQFTPSRYNAHVSNGFVQDEISLVENRLWLTLGGKIEHNSFTGFEPEPSGSLLWSPNERQSVWVSFAQATKIPARNEEDIHYTQAVIPVAGGLLASLESFGNPKFQSERLRAYEAGYRVSAGRGISLDLTGFVNSYNHLETQQASDPVFLTAPAPPHLLLPQVYQNQMYGSTFGAEASAKWKLTDFWRMMSGYTWFVPSLRLAPGSNAQLLLAQDEGNTPRNQVQLRSWVDFPRGWKFNAGIYRVGRLGIGSIPAYTRVDVEVDRRLSRRLQLGAGARNLQSPRHMEFNQLVQEVLATPVERSFYAKATWGF